MAGVRNVITTLTAEGEEAIGPNVLLYHYPNNDIMNGSLLTVESNHFCVLKSRGAILQVYEVGQFPIETPQRPIFGSIQQAFYGGSSPWQFEAVYVNRSKVVIRTSGKALSREIAEMTYDVDYYVHVETKEDAITVVQHLPYYGHMLTTDQLNDYTGPVVEEAVNQIVQVTLLEQVNEKIHDLTGIVHKHLQAFLKDYGVTLDLVKVLVYPSDERMRQLISLKAFGLSELEAIRHYTAILMAEKGIVSAPNMAVGAPFQVSSLVGSVGSVGSVSSAGPVAGNGLVGALSGNGT